MRASLHRRLSAKTLETDENTASLLCIKVLLKRIVCIRAAGARRGWTLMRAHARTDAGMPGCQKRLSHRWHLCAKREGAPPCSPSPLRLQVHVEEHMPCRVLHFCQFLFFLCCSLVKHGRCTGPAADRSHGQTASRQTNQSGVDDGHARFFDQTDAACCCGRRSSRAAEQIALPYSPQDLPATGTMRFYASSTLRAPDSLMAHGSLSVSDALPGRSLTAQQCCQLQARPPTSCRRSLRAQAPQTCTLRASARASQRTHRSLLRLPDRSSCDLLFFLQSSLFSTSSL